MKVGYCCFSEHGAAYPTDVPPISSGPGSSDAGLQSGDSEGKGDGESLAYGTPTSDIGLAGMASVTTAIASAWSETGTTAATGDVIPSASAVTTAYGRR